MVKTIDPAQRELVKGLLVGWGKTGEEVEELVKECRLVENENGDVIGVATFTMTEGQNINFAVPALEIIKHLNANKFNYSINKINNIYDTEILAKILKNTAGQVICSK